MDWRAKFRDVAGIPATDSSGYRPLNNKLFGSEDAFAGPEPAMTPTNSKRTSVSFIDDQAPPSASKVPVPGLQAPKEKGSQGWEFFEEQGRIKGIERVIKAGIKYYYSREAAPDHHPSEDDDDGSDPFIEQFLIHLGEVIDAKVQKEVSLQMSAKLPVQGPGSPQFVEPTVGMEAPHVLPTMGTSGEVANFDGKYDPRMIPDRQALMNPPVAVIREPNENSGESDSDSDLDPDGTKSSDKLTDQLWFQYVTLAIIGSNTVIIALEAHYIADEEKQNFFRKLEFWFCVAYLCELGLRLRDWGTHEFFYGHNAGWNWFDFIVTMVGTLTIFMATFFHSESSGTSVIRIFRMLRMLRIFRAMKFIKDIEEVIWHAFKATLKLFFICCIVVFIFGIMFCNLLWDTGDPVISASFGNLELAMWSMFRLMTMDNWVKLIEPTLEFNPNYLILFILYIFLASIALMSLVPAIFVEQSMTARERAQEEKERHERIAQRKHDEEMLHQLFLLADTDGSGKCSLEELKKVIFDHDAMQRLQKQGYTRDGDVADVTLGLFDMLEHLIEEHDHTAIQTTEKQFIESVFKQRNDDSKSASWRATTSIRLQIYRFTTKLRKDMEKMDTKIDSVHDIVRAWLGGGTLPSPRESADKGDWMMWDGVTPGPLEGSRGPGGDMCCGDIKKSPRGCGSGIFG